MKKEQKIEIKNINNKVLAIVIAKLYKQYKGDAYGNQKDKRYSPKSVD